MQLIDPKTGEPVEKKKKTVFAKRGNVCLCRIQVSTMVSIEKYSHSQQLERHNSCTWKSYRACIRTACSLAVVNIGSSSRWWRGLSFIFNNFIVCLFCLILFSYSRTELLVVLKDLSLLAGAQ
uniref:uncharacterized protein LOC122590490 n=1 Tax=Erigeron canadensis TaxID=72917 RepID=UPI001CB95127|nr:uncharacterized protein LOC122590490 [Erigeron canadensis]